MFHEGSWGPLSPWFSASSEEVSQQGGSGSEISPLFLGASASICRSQLHTKPSKVWAEPGRIERPLGDTLSHPTPPKTLQLTSWRSPGFTALHDLDTPHREEVMHQPHYCLSPSLGEPLPIPRAVLLAGSVLLPVALPGQPPVCQLPWAEGCCLVGNWSGKPKGRQWCWGRGAPGAAGSQLLIKWLSPSPWRQRDAQAQEQQLLKET